MTQEKAGSSLGEKDKMKEVDIFATPIFKNQSTEDNRR